ncbi:hypothetical protein, partial [Acinetobacter baumannii]|uniref:hypothetical protein n=1 Tax=Acinetobacter baumannii TaxID=470 RepID=UPI00129EEC8F
MRILSNKEMLCKLMAAGLFLSTAQAKINCYIEKNKRVTDEIIEDEEAFNLLQMYYLEEDEEALLGA